VCVCEGEEERGSVGTDVLNPPPQQTHTHTHTHSHTHTHRLLEGLDGLLLLAQPEQAAGVEVQVPGAGGLGPRGLCVCVCGCVGGCVCVWVCLCVCVEVQVPGVGGFGPRGLCVCVCFCVCLCVCVCGVCVSVCSDGVTGAQEKTQTHTHTRTHTYPRRDLLVGALVVGQGLLDAAQVQVQRLCTPTHIHTIKQTFKDTPNIRPHTHTTKETLKDTPNTRKWIHAHTHTNIRTCWHTRAKIQMWMRTHLHASAE
jgi:hypothetical protein